LDVGFDRFFAKDFLTTGFTEREIFPELTRVAASFLGRWALGEAGAAFPFLGLA